VMVDKLPSAHSAASAGNRPLSMERASTSGRTPSAMIITTCAPSPGGLCADARNFSFPDEESRQGRSLSVQDGSPSPRQRPTMKNRKDKSNLGRPNPGPLRSTRARTAGGKKLNPEVMASAEQKALEGLKKRTEEGHLKAGRTPPSQGMAGRRTRHHGSGEQGRASRSRSIGRLQHRAAVRAGRKSICRYADRLPVLLRPQDDVHQVLGRLHYLPRRIRNARRAVRGADTHSD